MKKRNLPDVGRVRRGQIVEAAVGVIAERGLQHLSLSEIEKRAGMSRGQLTYYFPAKEHILLAVFDRLLHQMCQRAGTGDGRACEHAGGWEVVLHLLERVLQGPPVGREFHVLHYTFLAQIGHRDDFRKRLATLYEEWRGGLAGFLAGAFEQKPPARSVSPRALAIFVQALLHGLAVQTAADPKAFCPEEMLDLCRDL